VIYMPYLLTREREGDSLARANKILPNAAPVIPIIEPVGKDWHTRWNGLAQWIGGGRKALLIVNPYQKDFTAGHTIISNSELNQFGLLEQGHIDADNLLPTLLIHETLEFDGIEKILASQAIKAVIHRRMLDAPRLISLLKNSPVEYHIFDTQTIQRSYRQRFDSKYGTIVLRDAFVKATNNQSYSDVPTNLHELPAMCRQGEAIGFADYLIETKKHPAKGAGAPKAAAIHIGYIQPEEESPWMRHFFGGPIKGVPRSSYSELFLLAAEKLDAFKRDNPQIWLDSHGCRILLDIYTRKQSIQPADVKEYTLLHYIEAMHRLCAMPAS